MTLFSCTNVCFVWKYISSEREKCLISDLLFISTIKGIACLTFIAVIYDSPWLRNCLSLYIVQNFRIRKHFSMLNYEKRTLDIVTVIIPLSLPTQLAIYGNESSSDWSEDLMSEASLRNFADRLAWFIDDAQLWALKYESLSHERKRNFYFLLSVEWSKSNRKTTSEGELDQFAGLQYNNSKCLWQTQSNKSVKRNGFLFLCFSRSVFQLQDFIPLSINSSSSRGQWRRRLSALSIRPSPHLITDWARNELRCRPSLRSYLIHSRQVPPEQSETELKSIINHWNSN